MTICTAWVRNLQEGNVWMNIKKNVLVHIVMHLTSAVYICILDMTSRSVDVYPTTTSPENASDAAFGMSMRTLRTNFVVGEGIRHALGPHIHVNIWHVTDGRTSYEWQRGAGAKSALEWSPVGGGRQGQSRDRAYQRNPCPLLSWREPRQEPATSAGTRACHNMSHDSAASELTANETNAAAFRMGVAYSDLWIDTNYAIHPFGDTFECAHPKIYTCAADRRSGRICSRTCDKHTEVY